MMKLSALIYLLFLTDVSGLLFPQRKPATQKSKLVQIAQTQIGTELKLRLDLVGKEDADAKMGISGLILRLTDREASKAHPKMPGADGAIPQISTGLRSVEVVQEGYTVTREGLKNTRLMNGCWEMVWKEGAPAGSILCGFEIPETIRRNSASLPQGPLYFNFPVWSRSGLTFWQEKKLEVDQERAKFKHVQTREFQMYRNSQNLLEKAVHYKKALDAAEKCMYVAANNPHFDRIPAEAEVMPIGDDLVMGLNGALWTHKSAMFGKTKVEHLGKVCVVQRPDEKRRPTETTLNENLRP
mmetsp:Transcript_19043/g.44364  ORF Transcript_19043/g.44364 Transcript_19043/m.44364 type:complete len:298 (+) Transcript_19043:107-1000(+)